MDAGIYEFSDGLGVIDLEQQIEDLVSLVDRLRQENNALRARQSVLQVEKADLLDRNEAARGKVENIVARLKELEQDV